MMGANDLQGDGEPTTQFLTGHENHGDDFELETLQWLPAALTDGWLLGGGGTAVAPSESQAGGHLISHQCYSAEPGRKTPIQDTLQQRAPVDM